MAVVAPRSGKSLLDIVDRFYDGDRMDGKDKVLLASAMNWVQTADNWIGNVDLVLVEVPVTDKKAKEGEQWFVVEIHSKSTGEPVKDANGNPASTLKAMVAIDPRYSNVPGDYGLLHSEEVMKLQAEGSQLEWVQNINPDHLVAIRRGVRCKLAVRYGGDDADGESDNGMLTHAMMNLYKDVYQKVDSSVSERTVEAKAFKSGKNSVVMPPFGRINDKGNGGHIILTRNILYGKAPTTTSSDPNVIQENDKQRMATVIELENDGDTYLAQQLRSDPGLHYLKPWSKRREAMTYLPPPHKPIDNEDWAEMAKATSMYGVVEIQLPSVRRPIKVLEEEYTPSLRFDFNSFTVAGVPGHVVTTAYNPDGGVPATPFDEALKSESMQDVLQELGMTAEDYTRSLGESAAKKTKRTVLALDE